MRYTTIMLNTKLKEMLNVLKFHPRESYQEVIQKLVEFYVDEQNLKVFVEELQKKKMRELWVNEKDEIWASA